MMRLRNWLFGNPAKVATASDISENQDLTTKSLIKRKPSIESRYLVTALYRPFKKEPVSLTEQAPLIEAIERGDTMAVKSYFQELNALPHNERNSEFYNLCALRDAEKANLLIVALKSPAYKSPASRYELMDVLLSNISNYYKRTLIISRDDNGLTIIHHAAKHGNSNIMIQLLDCAINDKEKQHWLNKTSTANGYTPLHWATAHKHTTLIDLLHTYHVDETIISKNGYTAKDLGKVFRFSIAPSSIPPGLAPEISLIAAIERGNNIAAKSRLTELNALPADEKLAALLNLKDAENANPLIVTLKSQSYPKSLLRQSLINDLFTNLTPKEQRLLITSEDNNGLTALHHAAKLGDNTIMQNLLACFENDTEKVEWLNKQSSNGYTALHWAADFGHKNAMATLQAHGTDVTIKSKNGYTYDTLKELFDASKKEAYPYRRNEPSPYRPGNLSLKLPGMEAFAEEKTSTEYNETVEGIATTTEEKCAWEETTLQLHYPSDGVSSQDNTQILGSLIPNTVISSQEIDASKGNFSTQASKEHSPLSPSKSFSSHETRVANGL